MYRVETAESAKGGLLEQAAKEAQDAWNRSGRFDYARDKIILYVRSIPNAETLADLLRCECYTAKSSAFEEKRTILDRWT
jgi:hypothetical protein